MHHTLQSPFGCAGLAWALDSKAILLADDQDLVMAATQEKVQVFDVPAILGAHKEGQMLAEQVKAIAFDLEWTAKRTFKPAHRRRFGLE